MNATENDNYSCLHYCNCFAPEFPGASEVSIFRILEMLLEAGADTSALDSYGNTPFMCICGHASIRILKLLLEAGSDCRVKNKFGKTGLDRARANNKKESAVWLEEYMNKLEKSIENCKTAVIIVLCVGKRKEEMKSLNMNKDIIYIIAKMLWRTRREVEIWE